MHVASMLTSNDDDAAMRRWALCSPLDDVANSDAAGTLPTIYSTRAGGGGEGVADEECCYDSRKDGDTGVVMAEQFFCLMAFTSVKKYGDHMILICY